jgi:hypothetical protein
MFDKTQKIKKTMDSLGHGKMTANFMIETEESEHQRKSMMSKS